MCELNGKKWATDGRDALSAVGRHGRNAQDRVKSGKAQTQSRRVQLRTIHLRSREDHEKVVERETGVVTLPLCPFRRVTSFVGI